MCRQLGLPGLGSDGRRDHSGTVPVAGVVLNDQNRPDTALLTAHHRGEIGIVNIAALDTRIHKVHTPPKEVPITEGPSVRPLSFSHAGTEFILCQCRKIPASSPRTILCPEQGVCVWICVRASLRSQQPQAPLHDFTAFDIYPRHPLAHRAGQAPPRVARRGPRSHFGRPGRARPPQGFAARGKTLGRRAAAAHFPALTAAAGSAPRFYRLRYTPAAPACSPRRSAHRGWCSEWPPGHPPAGGGRRSPPRPRP